MKKKANNSHDGARDGTVLSPDAIEILEQFFESTSPGELRENLLELYHTYLIYVYDTLPLDFNKFAMNMYKLMTTLGELEKEYNPRKR